MAEFHIRPTNADDADWIAGLISERWGAQFIVAHGQVYHCKDLAGFVALQGNEKVGLVTYVIAHGSCEIVSLDSLQQGNGIGTALLQAVKAVAIERGCKRLWLVTTNDNLNALRFYQKRGFCLVKIYRNTIENTRRLKPVPLIGSQGIPVRDEIELEMTLEEVL